MACRAIKHSERSEIDFLMQFGHWQAVRALVILQCTVIV